MCEFNHSTRLTASSHYLTLELDVTVNSMLDSSLTLLVHST